MKINMSGADRMIRVLLVAVLAVLYFTKVLPGIVAWPLIAAGAIFIATSLTGFCPLYAITGLSTKKKVTKA